MESLGPSMGGWSPDSVETYSNFDLGISKPDTLGHQESDWLPQPIKVPAQSAQAEPVAPAQDVASSHAKDAQTFWRILQERARLREQGLMLDTSSQPDHLSRTRSGLLLSGSAFSLTGANWDIVIVQCLLLLFLILIAFLWACCYRKGCFGPMNQQHQPNRISQQVAAFARKVSTFSYSKDLPPSYSKVDLTALGLSLHDHLNPPPTYEIALESMHQSKRASSKVSLVSLEHVMMNPDIATEAAAAGENVEDVTGAGQADRKVSCKSLPFNAILEEKGEEDLGQYQSRSETRTRKRSVRSEGNSRSRKVSFIDNMSSTDDSVYLRIPEDTSQD